MKPVAVHPLRPCCRPAWWLRLLGGVVPLLPAMPAVADFTTPVTSAVSGQTVPAGSAQSVLAGGTATGGQVGGTQTIFNGGQAHNVTVLSTGLQVVSSGGLASGSEVQQGRVRVESGGVGSGLHIVGGVLDTAVGARTYNSVVDGGREDLSGESYSAQVNADSIQLLYPGGLAVSATVNSGGVQSVLSGARTRQSIINAGGQQQVLGDADSTLVNGGEQTVGSGGIVFGTTVTNGGRQTVSSGGTAGNTLITRGSQDVLAGGSTGSTTLGAGADQSVAGFARTTDIQTGGRQFILSGGVAEFTSVTGGTQLVSSGGEASNTTVSRGLQTVLGGGMVSSTTVAGGADQVVEGQATSTTIQGGRQFVQSGGIASHNVLNGGSQTVSAGGLAVDNQITQGSQFVLSGGETRNTTVLSGGRQTISAGGLAQDVTVDGGRVLNNGGVINGLDIIGSGDQVTLAAGTLSGTVTLAGSDNVLNLRGGTLAGNLAVTGSGNRLGLGNVALPGLTVRDSTGNNELVVLQGARLLAGTASLNGGSLASGAQDWQNWGQILVQGGGELTLAGRLGFAGPAGTLTVSGTLNAPAGSEVAGNLVNAGTVTMQGAGPAFGSLQVAGQYHGANGVLQGDVSAQSGLADTLVVQGSLSGTTGLSLANDGSRGQLGESILFARTGAGSTGSFVAANPLGRATPGDLRLRGSPYVWEIVRQGNDWYLQSPAKPAPSAVPDRLLPEIPAYGTLPALSDLIWQGNLASLGQRLDHVPSPERDVWLKVDGFHWQQDARYGFSFDGEAASLTGGIGRSGELGQGLRWRAGGMLAWNRGWLEANGQGLVIPSMARSYIHLDSVQLGAYGQLEDEVGRFVRGVLLAGRERARISTEDHYFNALYATVAGVHLAVGQRWQLAPGWVVSPQLSGGYVNFNWSLVDDSITGRYVDTGHAYGAAAVRLERNLTPQSQIWLRIGATHEFGSRPALELTAPAVYLPAAGPRNSWQGQLGYQHDFRQGSLYVQAGGSYAPGQQLWRAEAGWQWHW